MVWDLVSVKKIREHKTYTIFILIKPAFLPGGWDGVIFEETTPMRIETMRFHYGIKVVMSQNNCTDFQ